MIETIIKTLEDWERLPLAIVTMAGPWLTPLIPAYFVAVAIQNYLEAPLLVAVIAGLVLEVVGIAGIANATRAYLWNRNKRKTDEAAPVGLSIAAVSIYFFTALLLTVVLELFENLAPIAPGMFIILSVSSGLILVLSAMQRRREQLVRIEKEERKEKREEKRERKRELLPGELAGIVAVTSHPTKAKAVEILAQRPDIKGSELGRELGRSESLGRKLKQELLPQLEVENMSRNGASGQ